MHYRVRDVRALEGARLLLEFEDGKRGVYDMSPLLGSGVFRRIADPAVFALAHVEGLTVAWPFGVDIAPEELYENCAPLAESAAA